jgi:hypothetical protein
MTLKNESNFILLGDGKMKRKLMLLVAAMAVILTAVSANASYVIVAENFGGDGTGDLDATAADTFYSGITAAGGSATWAANSGFDDNGAVSVNKHAAYLNLGSYINDTKGTADGLFELTLTISETTGTSWISLGFGKENTPSTDRDMTGGTTGTPVGTTTGLGTIGYRDADNELDMWGGPGSGGAVDGPNGNTGARTLTVTLDLTGYDGTTNFGKVTWSDSQISGDLGSYTYATAQNFGSILITGGASISGTISNLTLSQSIPEPATIGLLLIGSVMGFYRRR